MISTNLQIEYGKCWDKTILNHYEFFIGAGEERTIKTVRWTVFIVIVNETLRSKMTTVIADEQMLELEEPLGVRFPKERNKKTPVMGVFYWSG